MDNLVQQKINKIIVVSHSGFQKEKEICTRVKGVDVVVGGHTNTFLYNGPPPAAEIPEGAYPFVAKNDGGGDCLVVQAYAYGKYLGRLQVTFDDAGVVKSYSGNPILINSAFAEDPTMVSLLAPFADAVANYSKIIIATTAAGLDGKSSSCRWRECNMANLVTDAAVYYYMKHKLKQEGPTADSWTRAAMALWNGGAIRGDFETDPGGNLTLADLYTISPFGHGIEKLTLKGSVIVQALEHGVSDYVGKGKFPQISGMKVVYNLSKPNGSRVQSVMVRCADTCGMPLYDRLMPGKEYGLITNKYVRDGGDGYEMFKDKPSDNNGWFEIDVLAEYLKDYEPVTTGEEMRIRFVGSLNGSDITTTEETTSTDSAEKRYMMTWVWMIVFSFRFM